MASKKLPASQGKSKEYEVGYKKPPKHSQWKKGQSGNPAGYKVPQDVKELNALLDEILNEEISDERGNKMQKLRVALNRLILSKNIAGIMYVLDRKFGRIPQAVELSNKEGESFRVELMKPSEIAARTAALLKIKEDDTHSD